MRKDFRVEFSAEELMAVYAACVHCSLEIPCKALTARLDDALATLDELIIDAMTLADVRKKAAQSEAVKEERKKFTNTFVNLFRP